MRGRKLRVRQVITLVSEIYRDLDILLGIAGDQLVEIEPAKDAGSHSTGMAIA